MASWSLRPRLASTLLALVWLTACGGDSGGGTAPPVVEPPRAVAISISPPSASFVSLGETATFTATVRDQNGAAFPGTVTWASDAPDVFTVNAAGLVTAAGNGTGTLRASFQQLSATAQVTVRQVVATVAVSPAADTLVAIGDTATFTAAAMDANDFPVADATVTWESDAPEIATVNADGLVTATGDGEARITGTAGSASGSAAVVAATVTRFPVARLDTTVVVPIDAGGREWTFEVTESRWLPEMPVATLTRNTDAPGALEVKVSGPGWVRVDPVASGKRLTSVRIEVVPPAPFVVSLRQEDWPASDAVTARGYAVDRIPLPSFQVGGESALEAFGDSAEMRFTLPALNGGACAGNPVGEGEVSVVLAEVRGATAVKRLAGPLALLGPGESYRLGGADSCVRLWGRGSAAYALAGVERSAIDASRTSPSPVQYGGGTAYLIEVTERSVEPSPRLRLPQIVGRPASEARWPEPPRAHPSGYAPQGGGIGLDDKTEKWKVGEEFEWYTNDERDGVFQVVALYPPNVVLAVFKEDMPRIWTAAKAAELDEILNWLGSNKVQHLFKTAFGPRPPVSNTTNEQMVVMYNGGDDSHSTGLTVPNIDGDRTTTTVHVRDVGWGDKGWYHNLTAHELAHAWDFRNTAGFVGLWSLEGIASWFADENSRLATDTPLDANYDATVPLRGFRLRLPWTGDFLAGYSESAPYLRFLVTRLIFDHGESYGAAVRRVVHGFAEDWYGHYFTDWGQWDRRGKGPGLVERMREVVPGWDPVESRLDWMISFALDDHGGLAEYDIPFIRNAGEHVEPWLTIRMGEGHATEGQEAKGGNHYFLVSDPSGLGGSIHLEVTEGDASVEWKLVRYR